jgi:hypothetical protein
MDLKSVASFFDNTVAKDAYTLQSAFLCQIEPLDMYRTEGTRIKVRNMSADPSVLVPLRRVITVGRQRYLVSDSSADEWRGEEIRLRFVLQGADDLIEIQSIEDALSDTAGTTAYGSVSFSKYGTDERDSSDYHAQYHIFFGNETVPEDSILSVGDDHYLVRSSYRTPAGLIDALSNKLDSPVIDEATFTAKAYAPLTDSYADTPTTVRCVRVRWQDHFTFLSMGTTKYERGDMQVFVPLSVTPKAGDAVTLPDGVWTILSGIQTTGYHSLHVRRK